MNQDCVLYENTQRALELSYNRHLQSKTKYIDKRCL